MALYKHLRFILFVALIHILTGRFSGRLQASFGSLDQLGSLAAPASLKESPSFGIWHFWYKALNLPLSLFIESAPPGFTKGSSLTELSPVLEVLNSLLAAFIIYVFIQAVIRFGSFSGRFTMSSALDDTSASFERISTNLSDEKISRLLLFPVFGRIPAWETKRSIRKDMIFVYCIAFTASLGLEYLRLPPDLLEYTNTPEPFFYPALRWIVRVPLSLVVSDTSFRNNPLLIFLNALIIALFIGGLRRCLTPERESQE